MLSYDAETLQQDFAHAQSLTTDGYRPQLIAQQQAVQKAGATTNEYWAVEQRGAASAVTPDRAAMLMAMQGQRGTEPKDLKFITATVRVDFDKSRGRAVAGRQPHRAEEAADESGRPMSPRRKVDSPRHCSGRLSLGDFQRRPNRRGGGDCRSSPRWPPLVMAAAIAASTSCWSGTRAIDVRPSTMPQRSATCAGS